MAELQLFGGFAADGGNGAPTEGIGRKAEALICLLVLARGAAVTREQAAGLVWSDRGEEQARASLRQELSRLRRLLGEEAILTTRSDLRWNCTAFPDDVSRFTALSAKDDRPSLEQAAELYRGPLMDGRNSHAPAFQEYLDAQRRVLEEEAIALMTRLAEDMMPDDPGRAALWAARAIRLDPLRDTARRLEIQALLASGDRTAAAFKLGDLNKMLRDELGVDDVVEMDLSTPAPAPTKSPPRPAEKPLERLFGERPAIAVLPFRCLSGSPDDAYVADGMTEDVVNSLAAWRWFPVIGRSTTAFYRDAPGGPSALAAETGARYVLDGSLRRGGQQMRVTVELLDALSGQMLWSQRFDRDASDIFAIQDEISTEIAHLIEPEISRRESKRIMLKRPSELSAWELMHKARMTKFQSGLAYGTKEDNAVALEMFRQAAELDPGSSEAVCGIATCHWHNAVNSWTDDTVSEIERAEARALQARELDENNFLALATVGIVEIFGKKDIPNGIKHTREATELNPSSALAHHYLACGLEFGGEFSEALNHCEYILALSPRANTLAVVFSDIATCRLLMGDAEGALTAAQKSLTADPNYARGRQRLVACLSATGQDEEARAELAKLMSQMPAFSLDYIDRTYPFRYASHQAEYQSYFARLGVT